MIKKIVLVLACASMGAVANAKSSDPGFWCIKYFNGVPLKVPCNKVL
jgi:hypothetical protein